MTEEKKRRGRPSMNKDLEEAKKKVDLFDENTKKLTSESLSEIQKPESEQQTKLSQSEINKSKDVYLKPKRSIRSTDKFNEKFRKAYEFDKEYVHFIAENLEIIGESIEIWTKPYAGMPAEEWEVPSNKPVWGPRYLAEQIKRKFYRRLTMKQNQTTASDGYGQYYGALAVDTTVQRLDARPVQKRSSVFMSSNNF